MYYQVQVALDPQFENIVVNNTVEVVTDYEIAKDLEHFTVYYWRVKAIDPLTGKQSEWSTPCAFRIKAEDVTIEHGIDKPTKNHAYVWYGSKCFGLEHKFVRSYDTECVIPDAVIGVGMCDDIGDARIGIGLCTGVCLPEFDGFDLEILFTENNEALYTEDGYMLALEF